MTKKEITTLVEAVDAITANFTCSIEWENDWYNIYSNSTDTLTALYILLSKSAMYTCIRWEHDKETYTNHLRGFIY